MARSKRARSKRTWIVRFLRSRGASKRVFLSEKVLSASRQREPPKGGCITKTRGRRRRGSTVQWRAMHSRANWCVLGSGGFSDPERAPTELVGAILAHARHATARHALKEAQAGTDTGGQRLLAVLGGLDVLDVASLMHAIFEEGDDSETRA